ncbi:MAG: cation:proton antiporter [Rhodospirillales bacterium]|nr:cation:proton antiporter [Rhodospirillales bacterium]
MEYVLHILIVLLAARLLGRAAQHFGQPASVGQILAGVFVALAVTSFAADIPVIGTLPHSPAVDVIAQVGIFFLLLYTGIEMRPSEIAAHEKEAFAVALGGVAVPLVIGFALAWHILPESDARPVQAFVVGVALSVSSISVAAKVFQDFRLLHHPIGEVVVAAAIIDDVIGLVLLAVLTSMIATGHPPDVQSLATLGAEVIAFFVITGFIGAKVYPHIWRWVGKAHVPGSYLGALLTIALAYSLLAEALGLHAVLGPFMAGLFFDRKRVGKKAYDHIDRVVGAVTAGALGPLFFAAIGMTIDPRAAGAIPGILTLLVAAAVLGKLIGCGIPAWLFGPHRMRDAMAVGVGMGGRGGVELFIIAIAFKSGLFDTGDRTEPVLSNLYSALVLMAVISAALTPVLLRLVLHRRGNDTGEQGGN